MSSKKDRLKTEVIQELNDSWLNINVDNDNLIRPLNMLRASEDNVEDIYMKFTWLLSQPQYFSFLCKHIFNIEIAPFQGVILEELWNRRFPMLIGSRGLGKTFLLSLYSMIRALLMPESKVVIIGGSFRQSKFLHDYMERIWNNAPVLRDIVKGGSSKDPDVVRLIMGSSIISCLPLGDGSKIRGMRSTTTISDEFDSISREVYEVAVGGFGVVRPNPIDSMKLLSIKKRGKELKISDEDIENQFGKERAGNQSIISGTAGYSWGHFCEYWNKWRSIILSRGDRERIKELVFNGEDPPDAFNWKDYSVIRLPIELLPPGYMDEAQVANAKARVHSGVYFREYGAIFVKDSTGFFKRSLIESCVGSETKPIKLPSGNVFFDPILRGSPNLKYVIGVDPASEIDHFAISVVEVRGDHRRIVYCWTTNRKQHTERVSLGLTDEDNFYAFCARKIRDLMNVFPTSRIMIDGQGGGIQIYEMLHETKQLKPNDLPIWEIIEEDKEKPSDDQAGLHILEICQFVRQEWVRDANHSLRKSFEDKTLLFPRFDPVTLGLSSEQDRLLNRNFDTLEDNILEIEELKNELCLIEQSKTPNGSDRWDTPETRIGVGKKIKLRKDRYSALLMANMGAIAIGNAVAVQPYSGFGGFAEVAPDRSKLRGEIYTDGRDWVRDYSKAIQDAYR